MGNNKKITSFNEFGKKKYGEDFTKEKNQTKYKNNSKKASTNKKENPYANAPYNFIEFPDKVVYKYDNIDDLPKHDVFCDKIINKNGKEIPCNTGYIEYEFSNETPLYIGSGVDGEHFKVNDNHIIPGSTMRGVVRSNAEILSFSYPEFVEDRRLMYRDIAGSRSILKIQYNDRLSEVGAFDISDKVKAGYIKKENGNYYIYKAREENGKTFRLIDEFRLKSFNLSGNIKFMYNDELRKILNIDNEIERINDILRNIWIDLFEDEKNKEIYKSLKKDLGKLYSEYTMSIKNKKIDYKLNQSLKDLKKQFQKNFNLIKEKRNEIYKKLENEFDNINLEFSKELDKKLHEDSFIPIKENLKLKLKERGEKELEWRKVLEEKVNRKEKILCYETEENIRYLLKANGGIDVLGMELDSDLKGTLLNSQYIDGKKKHYFIFGKEIDDNKNNIKIKNNRNEYEILADKLVKEYQKELSNKIFDNYTKDKEERKNNNETIRNFYSLPEEGEKEKVIFYKLDDESNVKYFGRNPFLRMFYDCSIKDLMTDKIEVQKEKIDYTEAIFGFTNKEFNEKKVSYKGRVNFGDVKVERPKDANERKKVTLALMSPKPTSFQLYLEQKENNSEKLNTYNSKDAKLRGQKFYWLRETEIESSTEGKSLIKPIDKGANFKGKIHFENLADDELGLLLLSLNYDKDTQESVGMGKSYGYGRIKFDNVKVYKEDKRKSFLIFDIKEPEQLNMEKFKELYKDSIQKGITGNYEDNKTISSYLCSKHLIVSNEKKEKIRYMNMQKKEFSNRNILKTASEVAEELSDKNGLD